MAGPTGLESIAGQTVWVTGAGTGIGRSIALGFGREGCQVAISGRQLGTLTETAALMETAGSKALIVPADVADPDAVAAAHQAIVGALGEIDILVNNAGTNAVRRYWRDLSPVDMARVVDVNLNHV